MAIWIPCGGCEDFYCTHHNVHVYDCDCPEIQDWESDPYAMTNASEKGRALAALRPRATYVCTVCAAEFEALVRTTKRGSAPREPATCSPKCRQKRYRQRHVQLPNIAGSCRRPGGP